MWFRAAPARTLTARTLCLAIAASWCLGPAARAQQALPAAALREPPVRFAVIGDYGIGGPDEQAVAGLVEQRRPEIVLTVGDNNYPDGDAATIDANIGQYYHRFIAPYLGSYGRGARQNRFYPVLGNHDWHAPDAAPYLAYFTLPGNERYYDVVLGPLHVFALDSDPAEPDGIDAASLQAQWLQAALAASTAPFRIVLLHHAPHSSAAEHGSNFDLQWPYAAWGADLVLAGHDHDYERLEVDGLPFLVDGLGGAPLYDFNPPISGSEVRFNAAHGALFGVATDTKLTLECVTSTGIVVDQLCVTRSPPQPSATPLIARGDVWKYLDDGSDRGSAWSQEGYDDSSWSAGGAQLGYGDGDEVTVIGYGGDPMNKYVTTYFRKQVAVADPGAFREVRLRLLRDDGAIVHLNGVEVMRSNMPDGPVNYRTLASTAVGDPEEDSTYQVTLDPTALHAGTNLVAVELHQSSRQSSDVSFDLELTGLSGGVVLCPRGSVWRYRDDGADLAEAWRDPVYDDGSWSSGPAQLGYGDGDEQTVVSYGPDPNDKYITTYFRCEFQVHDAPRWQSLMLRLVRDDGVVVYLNGKEAYRGNLPAGHVSAQTLAGYALSGIDEAALFTTRIDPALLVHGRNVLAVEVHQADVTSSDLSMDLELIGW